MTRREIIVYALTGCICLTGTIMLQQQAGSKKLPLDQSMEGSEPDIERRSANQVSTFLDSQEDLEIFANSPSSITKQFLQLNENERFLFRRAIGNFLKKQDAEAIAWLTEFCEELNSQEHFTETLYCLGTHNSHEQVIQLERATIGRWLADHPESMWTHFEKSYSTTFGNPHHLSILASLAMNESPSTFPEILKKMTALEGKTHVRLKDALYQKFILHSSSEQLPSLAEHAKNNLSEPSVSGNIRELAEKMAKRDFEEALSWVESFSKDESHVQTSAVALGGTLYEVGKSDGEKAITLLSSPEFIERFYRPNEADDHVDADGWSHGMKQFCDQSLVELIRGIGQTDAEWAKLSVDAFFDEELKNYYQAFFDGDAQGKASAFHRCDGNCKHPHH